MSTSRNFQVQMRYKFIIPNRRRYPKGQNRPKGLLQERCKVVLLYSKENSYGDFRHLERKKWRLENFIFPRHSETLFEAETSEFRCKMKF